MRVAVEQHTNFAISESYLQFISTPALEMSFSGKLCILIYARLSRAVSGIECVFVVNNKGASWNTGWARLVPGTGGGVWNKINPNSPSQRTRRSRENSRIFSLPQDRDRGGRGVGRMRKIGRGNGSVEAKWVEARLQG